MYDKARFLPAGDKGVVVEFGNSISKEINKKIRSLMLAIEQAELPGIMELIPTYRSLLVLYEPLAWKYGDLILQLEKIEANLGALKLPEPQVILLPVVYGGEYGPDLNFVSEHAKLTPEEVIKIHTGTDYLIYMLGFTPGFPYLGGMDERIATPRLQTPRTKIPAGSVGIAGSQTGVYPIESPGGWQIIGRTPVKLFDPAREKPVLLQAGNYVRFYQITPEEYQEIAQLVEKGQYIVKSENYGEKEV
ncbi:sensor histidine kinase inhibitor, KipI family [Carboxydocella sporoproducens DSM 16521]|uniref:Sensor histidine kinase inhibitor, KipI family n=2 Tax=Carboxydocella TaxID=178898 RepID=A0A1T4R2N4_9FIRM|nr:MULTISPECIES: 5-oxoprolinase subunit PxpB [Carboxydocella]AVX21754.1 sensor histidine kinase inhibitor, KipI family [Carboxydocella thermautotrophica]AVX32160.1 sensor histidine kinase inhibitor, KipI family [Carboxydocella thermautotrophica]SKA10136.1 sensor histidine kinase inhibitor, KipI family [Carboxydocella sporoproducens DSM 16521]